MQHDSLGARLIGLPTCPHGSTGFIGAILLARPQSNHGHVQAMLLA